jgi:hypothetical protein
MGGAVAKHKAKRIERHTKRMARMAARKSAWQARRKAKGFST